MNRKTVHIIITVMIMLIVSRFLVRIIDATVQIDDDLALLLLLLAVVNTAIGLVSRKLYQTGKGDK